MLYLEEFYQNCYVANVRGRHVGSEIAGTV